MSDTLEFSVVLIVIGVVAASGALISVLVTGALWILIIGGLGLLSLAYEVYVRVLAERDLKSGPITFGGIIAEKTDEESFGDHGASHAYRLRVSGRDFNVSLELFNRFQQGDGVVITFYPRTSQTVEINRTSRSLTKPVVQTLQSDPQPFPKPKNPVELARELGDPSAILRDIGVDARLEDFTGSLRPGQRSAEWRIRIPVGPVEWVTFDYFETPEDEDDDYDLVYGIDELDGWGVKLGIPDARRTGDTPFDLQPSLVRKFPLFGKVIGVSWGRVVENSRTANVASRLADDKSSTPATSTCIGL